MNTLKKQCYELEGGKQSAVENHKKISNIGFSTKQQLLQILKCSQSGEKIKGVIFLDDIINSQQKEVAHLALGLLPLKQLETTLVMPDAYVSGNQGLNSHFIVEADFENLFKKYGQETYINYKEIVNKLGISAAYSYIEMNLARKQFIAQELNNTVIVQASHVKGVNGIFTGGEVGRRSNRNNLLVKADFNEKQ